MTSAVSAVVGSLALDELGSARAALAVKLAETLDEGAGMATAAVSKELRETLAELTAGEGRHDELDRLISELRVAS